MNPALLYLGKVVLCSGVLFGYYCLTLRNKIFHQWNRFYLLACVVLSLTAPLLEIPIAAAFQPAPKNVFRILNVVAADGEAEVIANGHPTFSLTAPQWAGLAYTLVAVALLLLIVVNSLRIYHILRSYPKTRLNGIIFLNTDAKGTPFSFFQYIIWNRAIDLNSETGQRIFQHELAHVQQRHTWDKVLLLLVLIPFWANPFLWLIRKELTALHEFAADQKAMQSGDAGALAQVILNTMFPEQHFLFTNHFFQSTIKRRLAMFTKLQNPKVSYLSRIVALPVLLIVIASFALKTKVPRQTEALLNLGNIGAQADTLSQRMYKDKPVADVQYFEWPKKEVHLFFADGAKDTISYAEAKAANLFDTSAISVIEHKPWTIEKVSTSDNQQHYMSVQKTTLDEAQKFNGIMLLNKKVFKGTLQQLPVPENQISQLSFIKGNMLEKAFGINVKEGDSILNITTKGFLEKSTISDGDPKNAPLFTEPEVAAIFPETDGGWVAFLKKNLNGTIPASNGAKPGTYKVEVGFIVDADGKLYDIKPLTNYGYGMEAEVVRVLKLSPDWIPANQNGQVVTSYRKQTVTFVVSNPAATTGNANAGDSTFKGVIVIDGTVFKGTIKDIPLTPDQIESVNVSKQNDALIKEYGPQAKNGVIKIISKAANAAKK